MLANHTSRSASGLIDALYDTLKKSGEIGPAIALGVLAVIVYSLYGFDLPLRRDNAQYIYTAQRLLSGEMPYQSLFDMKAPLTSFVTAAVLWVSQVIFNEPIYGVRAFFMGLSIATLYLVLLLARRVLGGGIELWLAPLSMLSFHGYLLQSAIGAEPKLLLLLMYTGGLILLVDKKWFGLGIVAALCAFTWQPSGVLFIAAILYAALQPHQQRLIALAKLGAGFLVPSALIFGLFLVTGAFGDLIDAILFLHLHLSRADENELYIMAAMLLFGFPISFPIIVACFAAFVIHSARMLWHPHSKQLADNYYVPISAIICVFSIASLLNFQSYPDFFVFVPFIALGAVVLFRLLYGYLSSWGVSEPQLKLIACGFCALLVVLPFLNAASSRLYSKHAAIWRGGLTEQKQAYRHLFQQLDQPTGKDRSMIFIGMPEVPALLRMRNAERHISLGSIKGYDAFIASKYQNGFSGWLEDMSSKQPGIVIVKMSDLSGFTEGNKAKFVTWLRNEFQLVSRNPDIHSDKFRSKKIDTWIRKPDKAAG